MLLIKTVSGSWRKAGVACASHVLARVGLDQPLHPDFVTFFASREIVSDSAHACAASGTCPGPCIGKASFMRTLT